MIISSIAAVAKNRVIGKDNQMPWHLPADLAHFKRTTMGHHIIMGRNNFEAIGRPLPGRTNIIITRDPFYACSNCLVTHSVEEALSLCLENEEAEAFIIGGGQIYAESLKYWDRIYLTEIDALIDGDVFFPEIRWEDWRLMSDQYHHKNAKNAYDLQFRVFEKK